VRPKPKIQRSIRLDADIDEALQILAVENRVPISRLIESAVYAQYIGPAEPGKPVEWDMRTSPGTKDTLRAGAKQRSKFLIQPGTDDFRDRRRKALATLKREERKAKARKP
jgi:hypothetical protein